MADPLKLNDTTAAHANTANLQAQLDAGSPLRLPERGTVYIDAPLRAPHKSGCGRILCDSALSYPVDGHSQWTSVQTRLVQLGKGPVLRLCGTGFIAEDPLELVGDGVSAIVEVEGNEFPATGFHRFRNLTFTNGSCAIRCLGGYYKPDGSFVKNETHADNSLVEGCLVFDCGTIFQSENNQAVNWRFRDCVFGQWKRGGAFVFADLIRGGHVLADGCIINCPKFTIFRLHDTPYNVSRLAFERFERDRTPVAGNYLIVVDYQGDAEQSRHYRWEIIVNGVVNTREAPLDRSKLYSVPAELPRDRWRVQIREGV